MGLDTADAREGAAAVRLVVPDDDTEPLDAGGGDSLHYPDELWDARSWLSDLRAWCLSRGYPPDPTLASCLARLSAFLPKGTLMDTGVFSPKASMNLFAAIIGHPGSGKSEAIDAARMIVPAPTGLFDAYEGPIGSGEGLAEAYMGNVEKGTGEFTRSGREKTVRVRKQTRWNAFLSLDEGKSLERFDQRTGSTIAPAIRRAWKGETLGETNATEERKRCVVEYHMGIAIAWQPTTVKWLIDGADEGTPQRFLFSLCNPKVRLGGRVAQPIWTLPPAHMHITFNARARQEIADDYIADHGKCAWAPRVMLTRAKVAALLACVETTQLVGDDHWRMAGMVVDTSKAVRRWLQTEAAEVQHDTDSANIARAAARAEAVSVASRCAEGNAERDEGAVLRFLSRHPNSTRRDVMKGAFKVFRRPLASLAIDRLIAKGGIAESNGKLAVSQ